MTRLETRRLWWVWRIVHTLRRQHTWGIDAGWGRHTDPTLVAFFKTIGLSSSVAEYCKCSQSIKVQD